MLKILEQCLKSDPELNKLYVIQQIINNSFLNDSRVISGKSLLN